ncbi:MAG: Hsp33 family molecular chaperone [Parvibaculales bacterium]
MAEPSVAAQDYVLPFRIEGHNVNGRVVKLNRLASDVLTRHDYPEAVSRLLGEALVLASMLGTMLKFDGRFILQLQGTGPITMLMADYTPDENGIGGLRGMAQFDAEAVSAALKGEATPIGLLGEKSHMAFTVDQGADMERYQGIVPLEGDTLADAALGYFDRSEQIGTALKLAAAPLLLAGGKTEWRAGGIVVQQTAATGGIELPPEGDPDYVDDEWNRLQILLHTTEDSELLDQDLSGERLAYRLFHEDGVRVFDTRGLQFACPCSRQRVANMLAGLPPQDVSEMQMQETIEVNCEFCNEQYSFTPQEAFADSLKPN